MPELIDRNKLRNTICAACAERIQCVEIGNVCFEVACINNAPTIDAEPVVHCKDCVYYHKPHVQRKDGTECDISEVPDEYKPFPLTNMCNSDYGINVGGKCEYDNNYAPYEDDKTVFRQPEDFCSRGRRKE